MRFIVVILLACILVLAATIGTIVIGSRSFEGTVVDKPYEKGLAWDEEHRNRERLGWSVDLQDTDYRTGKNDLIVVVRDKSGTPISDALVSVSVSRPSTREFDRTYGTTAMQNGRYRAMIDLPYYGNWSVVVEVSRNKQQTSFDNMISAVQEQ
jgi:nitrogen fixation protein FixH